MAVADTLQELATDIQNAYSAINTKGGTIPANKNTNNLATAIGSITNDDSDLVGLIEGTLTELKNNNVTAVASYSFYVVSPQKCVFPNCLSIGREAYRQSGIYTVEFEKCTSVGQYVFTRSSLKTAVFNSITSFSSSGSFEQCSSFTSLVLEQRCNMYGVGLFASTPFRNGTGGTVYCHQDDVSWYSTATNWSALESTTFAPIEENLITLQTLDIDISKYYTIVENLPTEEINTKTVYLIETQTEGTYEQWIYKNSTWTQLANITL